MESQKNGKIKTCLHFRFPTGLASYPLTWCEGLGGAVERIGRLWRGAVQSGGMILQIQKHSHRGQMCLHTLWPCYEAIQRELSILTSGLHSLR